MKTNTSRRVDASAGPASFVPRTSGAATAIEKWGPALRGGFQVLPNALLKNQRLLGLNETDVVVLAHLLMHWWFADRWPFPSPNMIARRMGTSGSTVRRSLLRLRKGGLISPVRQKASKGPAVGRAYNLGGLQRRLNELARNDAAYDERLVDQMLQQVPTASAEIELE